MDFTEIKNSFLTEIKNRAISPFFGTFILSWSALNWKLWYILLFINEQYLSLPPSINNNGAVKYLSKVEYINTLDLFSFYNLLWLPLFTTLIVIIVVYPISQFLYEFVSLHFVKAGLNFINGREKISLKESNILKKQIEDLKDENYQKIDEKRKIISDLQTKNDELETRIDALANQKAKKQIEDIKNKLEETKKQLNDAEKTGSDRFEEIDKLNDRIKKLETDNDILYKRNQELLKNSNSKDIPQLENQSKEREEYQKLKNSSYFRYFPDVVTGIELEDYRDLSNTVLKYYKINDIIGEKSNHYLFLTEKGDSILRFFYEEEGSGEKLIKIEEELKRKIRGEDGEISIEDLPF